MKKSIRGPPLPTSDFISRVTFSDVENASLLLGASIIKLDTRLLISLAALRRQCLEGDCLVTPPSRLTATQISRDLRSAWETLRGIDPAVCRARYVSLAKAAISEHNFEINIELSLSSWEPFSSGYSIDDTTHLQLKDTTNVQRPLEQEKEGEEVVYHNIAFSGWLLKKRKRVTMIGNPWRARFCVIVGRQLRSYEGNESSAEEARDIFLLSQDVSIQAETTLGNGSLIGTTTSTNGGSISTSSLSSSLSSSSSALITDTAGKTSINRQIFPEGFDMTVITSIKPPESVTERGILAPISISQSGQSFLFATFGESALEDRERWMAALRASQFGALGGDDESENRLGLTTNTTGNSSISHASFASPVRTSLKVKDTKSLLLTTPRRPQSIRMALNLNDPSSTSISMSERRRSSALSNLEIAHQETPRKSLPITDETRSTTTTPKVFTKSEIQTTPVSKTSSTLVAGVISTPEAGTISTPISSDVSSSSSTSNVTSSSFIPAPLPSSSVLASKILKLQELCRSKSVMKDLKSVGWDEANATRNNGVTVYPALDGGASSRGDAFISHPRNAILTLITSIPSRKIIDERFDKGETIETFDQAERPHTSIQHMTFYGIPPVSNRDYVTITHWCLNQDGTIMVVSGSIEDKRCPEITGVVRAELTLAAWVVRPRSVLSNGEVDETKGCDVTYMNFTDLKGWVPMTIKKTVSSQQALLVARVRDILDGGYLNGKPPLKQVMNVPIKTSLSLEDGFEKSTSISTSEFQTPLKPRRLSIDVEKVSSSLGMIKASTTAITKGEESNTDRTLQLEAEVVRLLSVIDTMKEKELGLRRDLATLTMRFAGISTSIGSSGLLKPGAHFSTQTAPVFSLLASASLQKIKKEEDKR